MTNDGMFPALVRAEFPRLNLPDLIRAERDGLYALLVDRGALLFRGFPVQDPPGFQAAVEALCGESPMKYTEQSSPRSQLSGNIYTSTDYPPGEEIFLHNESSYQASWPGLLFFCCLQPPETGGATPLADSRKVLESIDPELRKEFVERDWMVVRNFSGRFGVPWQQAFGATDRGTVERYCREHQIEYSWAGDQLRTRAVRKAVAAHPASGAQVWFNHATFFHCTTLPADVLQGLLALVPEDELPTNTYFGDGAAIPPEALDHLRACYRAHQTRFDWQQGDILVIDNMLTSHGREPYSGPRQIAVAMASPGIAPHGRSGAA